MRNSVGLEIRPKGLSEFFGLGRMDRDEIIKKAEELGLDPSIALKMRKDYLNYAITTMRMRLGYLVEDKWEYQKAGDTIAKAFCVSAIEEYDAQIKIYQWELTKLNPDYNKARRADLGDLITEAKRVSIAYVLPNPVIRGRTTCPFHDDKRYSMAVSKEKGIATCFHCNETWDVIGLVMRLQGIDFAQAVRYLTRG